MLAPIRAFLSSKRRFGPPSPPLHWLHIRQGRSGAPGTVVLKPFGCSVVPRSEEAARPASAGISAYVPRIALLHRRQLIQR
ncbi:hypothetical protein PaG_04369 [Moesziomyces aphidis]|uniref:Uncharacterized protein n=1 Tax=Moesziomyces aphidis TaxID=84754 RepID=W3VIL4_MOEAP|nr:hypothetical protein PaG_04369 [Moesziomyces aphidis]